MKTSLAQWTQTGSHIHYSQLTCHLSPSVLRPPCMWRWYTSLPSNSGLRELFFQKLDLCLSPWDSQHRLLRQQVSQVFRQIMCDYGTETSWPVRESNLWFNPVTAFDDSSTLKALLSAPFASEHWHSCFTLARVLGGGQILTVQKEEMRPQKQSYRVTLVVTGRTRGKNRMPWFFFFFFFF